jgi:O-acetyl-ADP-ribose deacetylase (regulator of RNase III)
MPFIIVRDDLTKMHVDAVVNTTNVKLQPGDGGVSAAIFKAAGFNALRAACDDIGGCALGSAVVTPGFDMPAGHIIHTPSMVWQDGHHGEEFILRSCYRSCLKAAAQASFESLAFPLIGAGAHGYPRELALTAATKEINSFLLSYDGDMTVYLAVFDHRAFSLSRKLTDEVHEYIDDHYVDARPDRRYQRREAELSRAMEAMEDMDSSPILNLEERTIGYSRMAPPLSETLPEPSFAQAMIHYIDSHNMTDPDVYKRANITKQNYYKIKMEKSRPKKPTVLALCVAMRLDLRNTVELMALAGYAFSPAIRADLIVRYFISTGVHDVMEINSVLFAEVCEKSLLGSAEK